MIDKKQLDFPTEVIELPSKGLLYPTTNPLSSGFIEIKHMTAKEEDILTSQNLIKKGIVLDKLFESIIVSDVNPRDIVHGDKSAILYATRMLAYGPKYTFKFLSNVTDSVIETTIDIQDLKTKDVDYSLYKNENRFTFTLPASKHVIEFKLLTHADEVNIDRDLLALGKVDKDINFTLSTRLRHSILSIDGNSDVAYINKFANNMLARDVRALREYTRTITPEIDNTIVYTHEDQTTEVVRITINSNFFWPTTES